MKSEYSIIEIMFGNMLVHLNIRLDNPLSIKYLLLTKNSRGYPTGVPFYSYKTTNPNPSLVIDGFGFMLYGASNRRFPLQGKCHEVTKGFEPVTITVRNIVA